MGYLRDIRRLTVALSRARLGLYILGRREVFEGCYELRPAFEQLLQRPDKLELVTGELWPSQRQVVEDSAEAVAGEATMEGVEHLGQYVFEMSKTKMEQLRADQGLAPAEAGLMSLESEQMEVREIEPIAEEEEEEKVEEEQLPAGEIDGEES